MRLKILVNFIGNVEGQSVRFRQGEEVEVPDGAADHFVRAHYADIIEPTPAVKVITKHANGKKSVK